MKKVWYLEGKENKKKKTVKLFVYEKEKVPTAHLDLSAFAELAQYDDWTIRFFHKDGLHKGSRKTHPIEQSKSQNFWPVLPSD